jgi:hypothetical protein
LNTKRKILLGLVLGMTASFCAHAASKKPAQRGSSAPTSSRDAGDFVIEKRSDGSTVKYKKKNTYDFEGVGIDGIHNKPSGSYVSNIKDVKARSIIRMRENFDAEVIDSSRQMK